MPATESLDGDLTPVAKIEFAPLGCENVTGIWIDQGASTPLAGRLRYYGRYLG